MNSRMYSGWVEHARRHPAQRRFRNRLTFYAFDLDELDELSRTVRGFAHNRFAMLSLHDRDYLSPGHASLPDKLQPWIASMHLTSPPARITLVTAPRWWGHVFNPVSFYLLEDSSGALPGLIAEVNNTFGDRHVYPVPLALPPRECGETGEHGKEFHVSPFNNMEGSYQFRVRRSADELSIGVDLWRDGQKIIETWIEGRGTEITRAALRREALRHPLQPWLTMPRILGQAVLLKFKDRLPVFRRPDPSSPRTLRSRHRPIPANAAR